MQCSEQVVIQTLSQSSNEINTHTGTLSSKMHQFPLIEKNFNPYKEKRKQGNKKEKLTESLHLMVNSKKVE